MSIEDSIQIISERALSGLNFRAGNGMSLVPAEDGRPLLSCRKKVAEETVLISGFPRHGLPVPRGSNFLLNLIPVRQNAEDLSEELPMTNIKVYVRMFLQPVAYPTGGVFGVGFANVLFLDTITVPHGVIPTRINATVTSASGATTNGVYYFFYAKLFSDGRATGVGSGDGLEDTNFPYTRIVETGWQFTPSGVHYPPISLI